MSIDFRRVTLRAALAAIGLAVAVLALSCGAGSSVPEDPRVLEIGSLAETATYALRDFGPSGIYRYLAPKAQARCSLEQFVEAFSGEVPPLGFKGLKRVKLEDSQAQVTVIWIMGAEDRDVEWLFGQGDDGQWRLLAVPGFEECG